AAAAVGVSIERQVRNDPACRPKIQIETEHTQARVERLLVKTGRHKRIRECRNGVEVGDVSVVKTEVVNLELAHIDVRCCVRLAAPTHAARVQVVEDALLWVADGEIEAEQLWPLAQVDDTAVLLEVAGVIDDPPVAKIDITRQPLLGGGDGRGSGL